MLRQAFTLVLSAFVLLGLAKALAEGGANASEKDRPAPEKWAHPVLKVTQGLILWLDSERQNLARKALGKPLLQSGDKVDTWYDASGHGRHPTQTDPLAQPTFHQAGGITGMRFDGEGTFLDVHTRQAFKDLTIVLVATPFANPGGFRAFLAMNQTGKNDYTSGLTIDQGPTGSARFATLNPEGVGFQGAINALKDAFDFGTRRRLTITTAPGAVGTKCYVDGKLNGERSRTISTIRMDHLTLGARCYNNEGGSPRVQGFLAGDIAEVLIYDRVLSDAERQVVKAYLTARYGQGKHVPIPRPAGAGKPLVRVAQPPAVQMLMPGFVAKELPVDLPNVNNIKYRPDGKLVALAYNGNIYLLSDSKGTGVEDKVELFWENKGQLRAPIGMALTPPGYKHGTGVFVACKGKLSLIVDADGDGKADKEVIVARGWKELPHGVDALGVAVAPDGSIYFGLGTADYTNAYLLDGGGKPHYDLKSERGTILKVSPDFRKREIVATGIRFSVALAFNRQGDLFATDQEGATWLPNGNPLDELLHIQSGRHYGFPPRHPRYLPQMIDEPSVFDYGPQHQSTCGLNFNEPVNDGPVFGPRRWRGDALITGYSRGKLYRTQLVKTAHGYVARNTLLACLNMLAVDACVSPKGELVIAVHSGAPDWGSGPTGKGKLYKVVHQDRHHPQPVLAWPAGPREVRIAFDAPLDPAHLRDLTRRVAIEYGKHVRAGDRFESLWPGYEAVRRQQAAVRHELPVLSAQMTGDRRTLVLSTGPHPETAHFAVTLPGMGRPLKPRRSQGELAQYSAVDLDYDLSGAAATWRAQNGMTTWSGWLPHLDLDAARSFTAGSADHARFWPLSRQPGLLTLRARLDLWQMLRPAVQPGSTLDYTLPQERVTLTFTGPGLVAVTTPAGLFKATADKTGKGRIRVKVRSKPDRPLPVEIVLETGAQTGLEVAYATNEDARLRALPLGRILVPWAVTRRPTETVLERVLPEMKDGNWSRGRDLFFNDQAQCSRCHQMRGQGGHIGPDLSNLIHRDYESVLRDIREPSAAINPDYISYLVELKNGRQLTGTVRSVGAKVVVGDTTGKETVLNPADIESLTPSAVSIMPVGLDKTLGAARLRDLLTFLLTEPLRPAPLECQGAPPPRPRSELAAVLKGSTPQAAQPRKLTIVLAAGPKDHGPGEHDYPLWQRRWQTLLSLAKGVRVSTVSGWPTPGLFKKADLIVFYSNNPGWTAAKAGELDTFLKRGGGLVYIHYAVEGHKDVDALKDRIGLAWKGGTSRFRHGKLELDLTGAKHPITRGFGKLTLIDESYWELIGDPKKVHVLATAIEDKAARPLLWTHTQGKGRVFVSIPGHYSWTFDDPLFRILLLRGIAWTAGESVDRFNELATVGARVKE